MPAMLRVDVTRGSCVESQHYGHAYVVDADGTSLLEAGETETLVFPRSAIKAIQALPLIETGAADALGFSDAEIALACSSHNSEARHVTSATRMLAACGQDHSVLECGSQWPRQDEDIARLHREERLPTAINNNCSGKHAGFVASCHQMGVAPHGYSTPEHPLQREIKALMEDLCSVRLADSHRGIDGCSVPTYATPLSALAQAFAILFSGHRLGAERRKAAERLYRACTHDPFMVAGTDRFCTTVMAAFQGRVFVKTGAEGVFCGFVPELGVGIAVKCVDGATRASEAMMAAVLTHLLTEKLSDQQRNTLLSYCDKPLHNRRHIEVGRVRCTLS